MGIIFHIGPRNCGKSLFVEQQLAPIKQKLYIGTLERIKKYKDSISRHQQRRDSSWILFEVTSDYNSDCSLLETLLKTHTDIEAVMLDGICTWFHLLEMRNTRIPSRLFTERLIKLIKNNDLNWFLVDVPAEDFIEGPEEPINYQYIQKTLISELNIKSIIDWNYE